jgi:hypothetical protein
MNVEELVAFISAQGYTDVKVNVFAKSFTACCRSPEYYIEQYYRFSISLLPSKPDGSELSNQLLHSFRSVYGIVQQ